VVSVPGVGRAENKKSSARATGVVQGSFHSFVQLPVADNYYSMGF